MLFSWAAKGYPWLDFAFNNRCCVSFAELELPFSDEVALERLARHGIKPVDVDMMAQAQSCVGKSTYRLRAFRTEAPDVVDCSGFTAWLYGEIGVPIPRYTASQLSQGRAINLPHILPGDLVFTRGRQAWYMDGRIPDGVGHVGMYVGENRVIHAAGATTGVIEVALDSFVGPLDQPLSDYRGIRRFLPYGFRYTVLEFPPAMMHCSALDILPLLYATKPAGST